MWWGKPSVRAPHRSQSFTYSTFKDIQTLCQEEKVGGEAKKAPIQSKRTASIFHRVRITASTIRAFNSLTTRGAPSPHPETHRIVVYLTSLRVVRSTFEDCRAVRSILRGFRVSIDERDLSMDASFLQELNSIFGKTNLTLPRVFIGGKYMGGADEIRQLHESGELKNLVQGFPKVDAFLCDRCGGFRFLLCDVCNGSHKCYSEKTGFRSCSSCNENGLLRCPVCC